MNRTRTNCSLALLFATAACATGCGDAFTNLSASLGGDTAGQNGTIDVIVINNTPQSAAFLLGTFDPNDPDTTPDVTQFGLDDVGLTSDPGTTSKPISFRCDRTLGVGSSRTLELTEANFDPDLIEDVAFAEGISFYDVNPVGEDPTLVGSAAALEALIGLDFNCGSIVILRLDVAAIGPDPFRIDFEVIPSQTGR